MGEDVGSGLLAGSNTTSGVPIEHLDYGYVRECKNSKELEKILKVLRLVVAQYYNTIQLHIFRLQNFWKFSLPSSL